MPRQTTRAQSHAMAHQRLSVVTDNCCVSTLLVEDASVMSSQTPLPIDQAMGTGTTGHHALGAHSKASWHSASQLGRGTAR